MSNTTSISTSSTRQTPRIFELKSTPTLASTKHTTMESRPHTSQCTSRPVRSRMIVCMKNPLVPIVPTTKKL